MKIAFDIDDVLWQLNRYICSLHGIDFSKIYCFNINSNILLPHEDKMTLLREYANPEIYREIPFDAGIDRLGLLCRHHDVHIKSNCLNEDVMQVKKGRIMAALGLPEENIELTLISKDEPVRPKDVGTDFDFFVDDCAQNLHASRAERRILVKQPWNRMIHLHRCTRVSSLEEALGCIELHAAE